ncbi:sensor histidine kinase [Microbacterium sp. 179-I 3D3 NHS]|uniref:sensor histidine kinase n=1 Tax=Microbacterium sp. 179-I 3D3 NHS TaxID=3142382 RepID=UPI00399EF34D
MTAARRRLTIRARLTVAFTSLLAVAGLLMVLIVNVFMRTVPTYVVAEVDGMTVPATTDPPSAGLPTDAAITRTFDAAKATSTIALRSPIDILNTTLIVSAVVLVAVLLAGALLAWVLAGRMLRPLQAINRAAQVAGTGSFDHRVGLDGPRDEVRDLSDTFDDMLGKLDRSFQSHRRFASNASHELRTPLATTQTMLEVALADPDLTVDELRAVSRRVLETNRRNIETVDALLDLADIERRTLAADPVDVGRLAHRALAEASGEIEARDIRVRDEADVSAVALGDEVLLRQAVSNLVRNAVRHNVEGGEIDIETRTDGERVHLRIENTGPLLDADQVTELTEPFRRGAGRTVSSAESVRGHGLGLAIVTSVVEAHRGELELSAREGGGLVVEMALPAASDA